MSIDNPLILIIYIIGAGNWRKIYCNTKKEESTDLESLSHKGKVAG
jgi:hypothetical protein